MPKFIDLTGERYGRLTVLRRSSKTHTPNGTPQVYWECLCDCGNNATVTSNDLRSGHTKSCGCLNVERSRSANITHGGRRTRLYNIWNNMKQRCINPKGTMYEYYGGRGISVCSDWLNSFSSFQNWAFSSGYADDLTLDRFDNDGDYCPENCHWIPMCEQAKNRRNIHQLTFNEKTMSVTEWGEATGFGYHVIKDRLRHGWSVERALTEPIAHKFGVRHNK